MRRSKMLRRILLAVLALGMIVGSALLYLSREMNRAADGFFTALGEAHWSQTKSYLAESLRSNGGQAWLKQMVVEGELYDVETAVWKARETKGGYGQLTGTVTRRTGAVVPVTMLFVRENLAWKLYAIRRPFEGSLPQAIAPLLPDKAEQVALVKRAVRDFAASVQSRNMSYFRSTLAPSRRELYTTEKLNEAFGHFFDIEEDLTSLEGVEPNVEDTVSSDDSGEVTLRGYFPTRPKQVHFLQRYAFEQTDWRLLSFKIDMQ